MSVAIVTPLTFYLGLATGLVALVLLAIVVAQILGRSSGRGWSGPGWSMEVALWLGAGAVIVLAIVVALLFMAR